VFGGVSGDGLMLKTYKFYSVYGFLAILILINGPTLKANSPEKPDKPINNERYFCKISKEVQLGTIRAFRAFDGEKKLLGSSASWTSKLLPKSGLILSSQWFSEGTKEVDFGTGSFLARVDVNDPSQRKLLYRKRFSFEITTLITSKRFDVGGIRNPVRRWREYANDQRDSFVTGWADVFAMSKGSAQLYIVARDYKNNALTSCAFDSSILAQMRQEAQQLSEELQTISNLDIDKCDYSSGDEIII
jgi:hypothetical protein